VENTWTSRDLPVLDAIVRYFDEHDDAIPEVTDLAAITGLDEEPVYRACRALNGAYIDLQLSGDAGSSFVRAVYPAARGVVGQWPSADQWVTQLVTALNQAADAEPSEEKQSKLRQAAQVIGGVGKEIVVQVIAAKTGAALPG
jgi:hypothetical protein